MSFISRTGQRYGRVLPFPRGPWRNLREGAALSPVFALDWDNGTTARDGTAPTTATRASSAYRTDWDGTKHTLTLVGSDVIRVGSFNDGATTFNCAQIEPSAGNLCLQSQTQESATWTKVRCNILADATVPAPDGNSSRVFNDTFGTTSNCQINQTIGVANATQYALSVWAKANELGGIFLQATNFSGGTMSGAFDLSVGIARTPSNGLAYIEDWGDGWYRCVLVGTSASTTTTWSVFPATSAGTINYDSSSITTPINIWQTQLEPGAYASSAIATTGAASTRAVDTLTYAGLSVLPSGSPFTMSARTLRQGVDSFGGVLSLSDGGAVTNRALMLYNGSSTAQFQVIAAGATVANRNDVGAFAAGQWQELRGTADTDAFEFFVDGASSGLDSAGALPTGIDQLNVGAFQNGGNTRGGLIGPIAIYDKVVP